MAKLRELRESKGYTQAYLADKLNMTRQGYSKIENGESILSLDRFLKICEILETSPVYLIYGLDANQVALERYNQLLSDLSKLMNDHTTQK